MTNASMGFRRTGLCKLYFLFVVLLFWCSQAVHAITVTATPSTCVSGTTGGTKSWSNASRALTNDNSNATVSVDGTTSRYLQCTNFGFAIPTGAVINGITVTVERKSSRTDNGGSRDAFVRLIKGGTIGTVDRATSTIYTTSNNVTEPHGSNTDLWGQTWTSTDINASTFGVAFAATKPSSSGRSHTVSVDVISVSVDYSTDITPPSVASINLASYNTAGGATVDWLVTFSEGVTGVDAGDFSLTPSAGVTGTSIASVTGSGALWTVTVNTGSGSGTLGLNLVDNDTVIDFYSNKLGGTGLGNGNFTGQVYTIDKVNPLVVSIKRTGSNPTNAATVSWQVIFNEAVTGVDVGDFALISTGTISGAAMAVTGAGTTYTVTASGYSGTGTLGLNVVDNDTIVDIAFNKLAGTGLTGLANGSRTGEVYTIDRNAPTVVSINRDLANPSTENAVTWTVTFSEDVTGVDAADFALVTSGLSGAAITDVSGSGSSWVVTVDPGYGSGTVGLNLVDNDTVIDGFTNPLGGSGAGNGNFTGQVYTITTDPLASYRMEQASWNGTTDEVVDQQGANPGTAKNSATTGNTQALTGDPGTCRSGLFVNAGSPTITKGYIDLTVNFPYFADSFTLSGWIRTANNATSKQWIFSHNTGGKGYALSLGEAGTGRLRFSSGGTSTANLDSPSAAASLLASNTWYFVVAVADFSSGVDVVRTLYAFTTTGALVSGFPVTVTTTG